MCKQSNDVFFFPLLFRDLFELQLCDRGICFSKDRIVPDPLRRLPALDHLPHLLRVPHRLHLPQSPLHDGSAVSAPLLARVCLFFVPRCPLISPPFPGPRSPLNMMYNVLWVKWGDDANTAVPGPHPCQALGRAPRCVAPFPSSVSTSILHMGDH